MLALQGLNRSSFKPSLEEEAVRPGSGGGWFYGGLTLGWCEKQKGLEAGQGPQTHRAGSREKVRAGCKGWVYSLGVAVWGPWGLAEMPVHLSALARTWGRGREGLDQAGTRCPEVATGATKPHSPESKTVPQPLGESRASWSKVRILPPALRMRLRARLLTRSAHTWGTRRTGVVRPLARPPTAAGTSSPRPWPSSHPTGGGAC